LEQIDCAKMNKDFKYEIASKPGAEYFQRCFSCGTCTASCPVSEIDENFNPRLIIRKALLGMKEELLSSEELWHCVQCYTCYARCPQDVRFTDIMKVLRDMATEEGYAPKSMAEKAEAIDRMIQKLRHKVTEYVWQVQKGKDPGKLSDEIKKHLASGLKEL